MQKDLIIICFAIMAIMAGSFVGVVLAGFGDGAMRRGESETRIGLMNMPQRRDGLSIRHDSGGEHPKPVD